MPWHTNIVQPGEQLNPINVMMTKEQNVSESFSNMLISVLAHDLRQPFSALITAADIIKYTDIALSEEELHTFFERIHHTASKSIELLDGLIFWMKSQKEGYTDQKQPLLLRDLIYEANGLYQHEQVDKSIDISNAVPEHQLVRANKEMLQFINRNILSNATKYSPSGGIINITCSTEDDWITVAFTDQGMGIPKDELGNLFNIHDAEMAENNRIKSAGIALNICQDMIQRMNGKLWAESVHGNGATFYYSLPLLM